LKLIFAGTPANAARTLEALLGGNHEVVAVLTRPDAPLGRKRVLTPSPTAQVAEAAGIPVIKANRVTPEVAAELTATGAELGVIVAYGALLKDFALKSLPLGWVNLHYSLLPDWRGAAPVQNAIIAGDRTTGVTLFQLDEGMDTGPIFGIVPTEIQPGETSGRLLHRLTELGITLLNQELPRIESGVRAPEPQNEQLPARPANKPTREQALINWSLPARTIENLVLGMNPEPMAHTLFAGEPLRILDARAVAAVSIAEASSEETNIPGAIFALGKQVLVRCHNDFLQLLEVQPAGKTSMNAMDWWRGAAGKADQLG
jgi:methionyl-tRNA formyltransferase